MRLTIGLHQKDTQLFRGKELFAAIENFFEDGCCVSDRVADDAQYLRCRRLLSQRLLGLVEQPRVLDCDGGLVGKGLHQLDMLRRKCAGFLARNCDDADRTILAVHGHKQDDRERRVSAP